MSKNVFLSQQVCLNYNHNNKLRRNSPVVIHKPDRKIVLFLSCLLLESESVNAPIIGVRIKSDNIGKLILGYGYIKNDSYKECETRNYYKSVIENIPCLYPFKCF